MSKQESRRARFFRFRSLFTNWIMSVGIVVLLIFLGQFIDKLLFPGVVLLFQYILMRRSHRWNRNEITCNLLPHVTSRVLFFSAIVMVAINFYYLKILDPIEFENGSANKNIPYIALLIIAPISVLEIVWSLTQRSSSVFCRECRTHNSHFYEHGFIGRMLSKEGEYQLRLLLILAVITTLYSWIYYFDRYSNANLNMADRFYFNWLPVLVYLLTVFYMLVRYWFVFVFCEENTLTVGLPDKSATILRFIVMHNERILLTEVESDGKLLWDIPLSRTIFSTNVINQSLVSREFESLCGRTIEGVEFRVLYQTNSHSGHGNAFHILVRLPSRDVIADAGVVPDGRWLSAYEISREFVHGKISPMFGAEIHRVYIVASAYKTYDHQGFRRYKIRHYMPLFSMDELMELDVDFNDQAWLLVAKDNEDRPLFYLRCLWRKYVGGIEM